MALGLATPALAQAPDRVDYQGVLRDPSGQPMNGPVDLVLRIWDHATSQDPADLLYQETHTGVSLIDGVFQVEIGQGATAVGTFDEQLFADPERWLEVEVGGERLVPRQKFSSVAYALRAQLAGSADHLDGLAASELQRRVVGTCPGGQSIRAIASDGSVTCEPDDDTLYTAGNGIMLQGTTFLLIGALQQRVTGVCPVNSSIRVISVDGSVTCEDDTDTNTTYQAGAGLGLSGTTFSIANGGVTTAMLAPNAVTNPILATSAVDSRVVLDSSITASDLQADSVTSVEIAAGAVGTSEIANGAVTTDDIAAGTLTGADVANDSLPASVLSDGAGGDFTSFPLAPFATPDGVTLLSLELDAPASGLVIATVSGYAVPVGGTTRVLCEIRQDLSNTETGIAFEAFNGTSSPFGGTRGLQILSGGTVTISLFCETNNTLSAQILGPQLTAVFIPTTY